MDRHTLLIDGDILAYRIASANEEETEWGDDLWTLHSDLKLCRQHLDGEIAYLKAVLKADCVVLAFSDAKERRFREQLMPSYKGSRAAVRKPVSYAALVSYANKTYKCETWKGLEADDVLGILATTPGKGMRTVVSDDKDLMTVPCHIYRSGREYVVCPEEADYNWMYQTLVGDQVDGYKGCPGVGPKTAEKLLGEAEDLEEYWDVVVKAYSRAGCGEEEALVNARMARILRHGDYDMRTGEVDLWTPPTVCK